MVIFTELRRQSKLKAESDGWVCRMRLREEGYIAGRSKVSVEWVCHCAELKPSFNCNNC